MLAGTPVAYKVLSKEYLYMWRDGDHGCPPHIKASLTPAMFLSRCGVLSRYQ